MKLKIYSIKLISFYQRYISRHTKPNCKFYPVCSVYTKEAINKYGLTKGSYLGFKRILRCHPWQTPQVDLVP